MITGKNKTKEPVTRKNNVESTRKQGSGVGAGGHADSATDTRLTVPLTTSMSNVFNTTIIAKHCFCRHSMGHALVRKTQSN